MSDVRLRPAQQKDTEALVALLQSLFELEAAFEPDAAKQRRALRLILDSPLAHVVVAECEGKVVGMASLQFMISTAEGGLAGFVEDVIVDSAYRRQGIGQQLLTDLVHKAKRRGVTRLQLLADRENAPALAFYAGLGWQTSGMIDLKYQVKQHVD
jgi:ribosomal protein S18 acetylase RimI-like enzyme